MKQLSKIQGAIEKAEQEVTAALNLIEQVLKDACGSIGQNPGIKGYTKLPSGGCFFVINSKNIIGKAWSPEVQDWHNQGKLLVDYINSAPNGSKMNRLTDLLKMPKNATGCVSIEFKCKTIHFDYDFLTSLKEKL